MSTNDPQGSQIGLKDLGDVVTWRDGNLTESAGGRAQVVIWVVVSVRLGGGK